MTQGQRAMVAAKICLMSKQTQRETAKQSGLNAGYIGQAAIVLEYAPELTDSVIAGKRPLNEACAEAQKRKEIPNSISG
jgi:hypothetical protein